MDLTPFREQSLFTAMSSFFQELNVPVSEVTEEPVSPADLLSLFNEQNAIHALIDQVYFLGMVNESAFDKEESNETLDSIKDREEDYDGILIFGIELNTHKPNRTQLAEITRLFNREWNYTPVTLIFKYNNQIAFANSERLKYKQTWREGEKVGKVSLLKDIDIEHTHTGHLRILQELKIQRSGRNAILSFSQLYYYWQSVFSISVLNKTFYEEIIKWFNKAIQDIRIPGEQPKSEKHKDFTVRLIARLIFIWFLKELKVVKEDLLLPEFNNGDENDLIKPNTKGSAYYKFILQNLFFNALNAEENERQVDLFDVFSSSYPQADKIKKAIFYSPYLSGGLFDIHPNDWCELEKVNNAFEVPDHLFLDAEKGLNSILSSYKFTIAENTPLEEEIAVDPEMLGRIFENLLAEQSDDTKEAARKNAGAFYTPRPVVSYMCRNTLLKHLDMEIKPENGKKVIHKMLETTVLDPACGSGAFPMGMLEEMMQVLETVDPEGNLWVAEMLKSHDEEFLDHIADFVADKQTRYVKKLGLLRNCLFGIDLLEYAVEITKLRCWLSLIVEQKVDFGKPNYNLKPLPNLEFKFYKKNSLLRYYQDKNLNDLIDSVDNEKLLGELVDLENEYFIAKSSRHGNKEEIKEKIITLLEKVVDSQSDKVQRDLNVAQKTVNHLVSSGASEREIKSAKKKVEKIANELADLAVFRNTIKDYFIERVVFPGIFNKKQANPGFDLVIGNPPYVNTKQISSMGLTKKLEAEYGYCDDLYNHFTIRGLELLKKGGLLSYITSDTFLVIRTKENMRRLFIGANTNQNELSFESEDECALEEIVNTPKAFAAMVDTAIFNLKKEKATPKHKMTYVDLRFPNAETFGITKSEWETIKSSSENLAGWEKVLNRFFTELGNDADRNIQWTESHTCDNIPVLIDEDSRLKKFRTNLFLFHNSLNYSIFPPSEYNCQLYDKIIKPVWPQFKSWWPKVETSKKIEKNRNSIERLIERLKSKDVTFLGLLSDGGQGLATGDNGGFLGVKSDSKTAINTIPARPKKLFKAIQDYPAIKSRFPITAEISELDDAENVLHALSEAEIRNLFDSIKANFGLRVLGKGFIYRIVDESELRDIASLTDKEKENGIESTAEVFVRYDKGDRDGNKWLSDTPFAINWNNQAVSWLKSNSGKSGAGMPVVRNPQFYFKPGFSWNIINGTRNSNNHKFKFIEASVNDVGGMKLSIHDSGRKFVSDKYVVCICNSFLNNRLTESFINFTVNFQMNDARQIPIIIPTKEQLAAFESKFDECFAIQQRYFNGDIEKAQARAELKPIEDEIDEMVNQLYGITASVSQEEVGEDVEEELIELEEDDD